MPSTVYSDRDPFFADGETSASDSEGDANQRSHRHRKRSKKTATPTYAARKEEKQSLADELRLLEARLDYLRVKAGLPSAEEQQALARMHAQNVDVEATLHENMLKMARFQSLLSSHLNAIPVDPMATRIHLSADADERHATLRAIKEMKLRRAHELVVERLGGANPRRPYASEERFLTASGAHRSKRFDVHQFSDATARQLFDALLQFVANVETSVAASLGHLAIQDHTHTVDATTWTHHLVSTTGAGYVQELNAVGFATFVDGERGGYGVVACDAVDEDDLYPYAPADRIRKDVTAALLVHAVPGEGEDALPIVVLKRCVFVTIHKPQFVLPPTVMDDVCASASAWSHAMVSFLKQAVRAP